MSGEADPMRRPAWLLELTVFLLAASAAAVIPFAQCSPRKEPAKPKIRPPGVAGGFYPGDAAVLRQEVDRLLAQAQAPDIRAPVIALISPHAGYMYSGGVAAYGYSLLEGRDIKRVVVIAPSHLEAFPFASVYDGDAYETPLGSIPVDKEFAKKLARSSRLIRLSDRGHRVVRGRAEHSLEVQLPFLQRVLGEFTLVPVVMGDQTYETCRALGVALAKLIQEPGTLIVASSDLSHYHPYKQAVKLDHKVIQAIEDWDYLSLHRSLEQRVWEACGGGPIVAAMMAAERLGANEARVLKYANSGDVTGDHSRVVGYVSIALVKSAAGASSNGHHAAAFTLSDEAKRKLLEIAKKSVEMAVREGKRYECPPPGIAVLERERGAFVTLKRKGRLRGCIGHTAPTKPLYLTVRDVAILAALEDPRFPPVRKSELDELEYEISVLSPLHHVLDVRRIRVGRDGLVVKQGYREGLLLPQVPVEQGWDLKTFLRQTCLKAGLPPNAWRDEATDIFAFTAVVFGDEEAGFVSRRAFLARPRPEQPAPRRAD